MIMKFITWFGTIKLVKKRQFQPLQIPPEKNKNT